MKKKRFIKPSITVVTMNTVSFIADSMNTSAEDYTKGPIDPPKGDGPNETITEGDGSDAGSKNNSGFLWDNEW